MSGVPTSVVQQALGVMFQEIMSKVNGYALDEGDSLFETLATITAEEASRPVSGQSANLAAQVNHIRFYMDAVIQQTEHADWDGSWQIGPVTDVEWQELIARLKATTEQSAAFMATFEAWDVRFLGGAIGIIAHCAYHLGEIRQGIGVIRHPIA